MYVQRFGRYILLLLCVFTLIGCKAHKLTLHDIIEVPSENIVKVGLDIPNYKGDIHNSTKQSDIDELMDYLNSFEYEKIRGDVTTHMEMSAPMIYIYGEDTESFLVPYDNEVMIDQHLYRVKDGQIDYKKLKQYYKKIKS